MCRLDLLGLNWPNPNTFRTSDALLYSLLKHGYETGTNLSFSYVSDGSAFTNVARRATHTILALFGIAHNSDRVVAVPFPLPCRCCHALNGREPAFLVSTICSSCFESFVGDVVGHIANMFPSSWRCWWSWTQVFEINAGASHIHNFAMWGASNMQ